MKLAKTCQCVAIMTALALIYIHMQMQIIDLACQGKVREKKIVDLNENNDLISFNISRLKSANYLGGNLLAEDSELTFRGNDSIIQLVTAEKIVEKDKTVALREGKKTNPLIKFLSFRSQTEARAAERKDIKKPWLRGRF